MAQANWKRKKRTKLALLIRMRTNVCVRWNDGIWNGIGCVCGRITATASDNNSNTNTCAMSNDNNNMPKKNSSQKETGVRMVEQCERNTMKHYFNWDYNTCAALWLRWWWCADELQKRERDRLAQWRADRAYACVPVHCTLLACGLHVFIICSTCFF